MTAISAISAAMGAVNSALEQFDRALLTTVTEVNDSDGSTSGPVKLPDGLAGMDTARLAAQAALVAANASISMLDDVIKMGEYENKNDQESQQTQQTQQSQASQQNSPGTGQLMAYAQILQSSDAEQPASAPPPPEEPVPQSATQPE